MRSICLLVLTSCALLALAAEAGTVQELPVVVRFRLADPHSPTFYVRWEGHRLRMARSAKEVQTAKPLGRTRTKLSYDLNQGAYFRYRDYAEMKLTGPVGSFTEVRLEPSVHAMLADKPTQRRPDPTESMAAFAPTFHYRYRDASGAWWDYVNFGHWDLTRFSDEPEVGVAEVPLPDPKQLSLAVSTESHPWMDAQGRVGVEVLASAGPTGLHDLRRNGRSVPVRLVVRDAHGKVVSSATSTLPKLIGWLGGRTYLVRAPVGRCTVTATLGPTPFSKTVTASWEAVVEQRPR